MEDLKEEAKRRIQIHEAAITDFQRKDPIIAGYQNNTERWKRVLVVMRKVRTLPNVIVDVILDLITDIIN